MQNVWKFTVLIIVSLVPESVQWADCGIGRGSLVHFSNINIGSSAGNLTVSFNGVLETGLIGPPKLNVTLERNLNGPWVVIPCINKIGSCMYSSPCEFIKLFFKKNTCPPVLRGKGCSGLSLYDPIPFYFDPTVFNLATASNEAKNFLTGSALRVQLEMIQEVNNQDKVVGCVSFFITLRLPCTGFLCGGG